MINWENGVDAHILLCIKQITNEDLVKSLLLRELYSVLCGNLNGKEIQKRGDICMHIADSLCCTVEINITSKSNYIPIKIK